jgi:glycogen debranching enzyme
MDNGVHSGPDSSVKRDVLTNPGHFPFTISGIRSYFIGFTDLVPDNLGNHIKDEMNGLWIPPLRLFKNITVSGNSRPLKVVSFSTLPWKRIFDFRNARIELMMTDHAAMLIKLFSTIRMSVNLEFKPIPVWLDARSPEHSIMVGSNGRRVTVDFPNFGKTFGITFGKGKPCVTEEKMRLDSIGESFILIEEDTDPSHCDSRFNIGRFEKDAASPYSDLLTRSELTTGNRPVDDAYYWSRMALAWLSHTQDGIGTGITAGHPEFPWYFGFDTFLTIDALLECGMFDIAAGSLEILSLRARGNGGRIPHEIITNGHVFNEGDLEESAMFATALLKYYDWTLDRRFLANHAEDAYRALCFVLDRDMVGPGAMEDPERGKGKDIDTMCFFVQSVESIKRIRSILDDIVTFPVFDRMDELIEAGSETRKTVEDEMWIPEQNTYANRIVDGSSLFKGYWTSMMPFYCHIAGKDRFAKFAGSVNGGLTLISGRYGIRADMRGAAMPVQNGMMCMTSLFYGDGDNALKFFRHNLKAFGKYSPCSIPEITNRRNGCYMQAWSSAMLIHPLIGGFIGIDVKDGLPSMKPNLIGRISDRVKLKGISIGGRTYDCTILADVGESAEFDISPRS